MQQSMKWRERLGNAPDVKTVEDVMAEYVASLGAPVEALPAACRRALLGELDVQSTAVTLLHEELRFDGSEEMRSLLRELAYTFAAASVRITMLFEKQLHAPSRAVEGHG